MNSEVVLAAARAVSSARVPPEELLGAAWEGYASAVALLGPQAPVAYVFTSAVNSARDEFYRVCGNKSGPETVYLGDGVWDLAFEGDMDAEGHMEKVRAFRAVVSGCGLSPAERLALYLRAVEGFTPKESAEELRVSEATERCMVSRARRKVRG